MAVPCNFDEVLNLSGFAKAHPSLTVSQSVLPINTLLHSSDGQGDLDLGHSRGASSAFASLDDVGLRQDVFVPAHYTPQAV